MLYSKTKKTHWQNIFRKINFLKSLCSDWSEEPWKYFRKIKRLIRYFCLCTKSVCTQQIVKMTNFRIQPLFSCIITIFFTIMFRFLDYYKYVFFVLSFRSFFSSINSFRKPLYVGITNNTPYKTRHTEENLLNRIYELNDFMRHRILYNNI